MTGSSKQSKAKQVIQHVQFLIGPQGGFQAVVLMVGNVLKNRWEHSHNVDVCVCGGGGDPGRFFVDRVGC